MAKDAFDDSRRLPIHQQRRVLGCTLAVAVRSSWPHPDSPLCLGVHYIPLLAAAVPHVPLIEQILERHQLVAVFILGVNIVVDSDVAHIIGREYLLDIKTGVQLVSSKAGKILCDDDGDVAVAHVIHHLFKGWAIEIRAGIAIVHIKSGVLEPILIGVLLQDKFLVLDTVGVALQIIISGQTAIERRDLLVWL